MVLEIYDFPLRMKAHSIWHLATIPLTVLWWSSIRNNVEFRTSSLLKKSKTEAKKVYLQMQRFLELFSIAEKRSSFLKRKLIEVDGSCSRYCIVHCSFKILYIVTRLEGVRV
ncbi:hypothetical protein YC2023_090512 [Brassica napus]